MKCLVCKNTKMKRGTTMLPIERGSALLLITDIPAQICSNCGEPYIDEAVAQEVEDLANQELSGSVSYRNAHGKRTVMITEFA
jgi:YgiT-type zinc finger domain-containing protein